MRNRPLEPVTLAVLLVLSALVFLLSMREQVVVVLADEAAEVFGTSLEP